MLVPSNYVEKHNGQNTDQLVLFNWPIITLNELQVHGQVIPYANQATTNGFPTMSPWGYRYAPPEVAPPGAPAVLEIVGGWKYWRGNQTTIVSYRAGYNVSNEIQTIPGTPFQVIPIMPFGQWATDEGVIDVISDALMVPVASNSTPLSGQYIPPNPSVGQNYYAFSADDVGLQVSLSYGYVPADIEQALLETMAERIAYRARPGIRSQSLAGQETIAYGVDNRLGYGFSSFVMDMLCGYCNVLPPPIGADV
jgi:hypothetical protein